jgi:hypothetical protein
VSSSERDAPAARTPIKCGQCPRPLILSRHIVMETEIRITIKVPRGSGGVIIVT